MLDIWPELPIYLHNFDCQTKEGREDVAAALRLNHRVSGVRLDRASDASDAAWESFMSLMQQPFPALTRLWVHPSISINNAIPRSFLRGSAPVLRNLVLIGVSFPTLPELLLSATNLVLLRYDDIP